MRYVDDGFILSAQDLIGHANCSHLTALDIEVATGQAQKPKQYDPLLEILRERGQNHEQSYIEHLQASGLRVHVIEGVDITDDAVSKTFAAMEAGHEVIVQAALRNGKWLGRADILRRVEKPCAHWTHSYEVVDTKLARETKGGTVLQLCLYGDLLEHMQGIAPEWLYVVSPWSDFEPQRFRFADYAAYYRRMKSAAEDASSLDYEPATYPDPTEHCDICRWQQTCDDRRRQDDHLCLVAGISKNQISEFEANGIKTLKALAELPGEIPFKPQRGALHGFEKSRAQASIQQEGRKTGEPCYRLLDVAPELGLAALPQPSDGDVFFDIESDQFVGEHGIEYLFGYTFQNENGEFAYVEDWAFDRAGEKAIFERFADFVAERRRAYPDMHVYHFGGYESGALKRLMGRYATREGEVDNFLRGRVLVDLLSVVRNALMASVESYSLKQLEPFYAFTRQTPLRDANIALTKLTAGLELGDIPSISEQTKTVVASYNRDDCLSTAGLRNWLETLRDELIGSGIEVPRREPGKDGPSEELTEQQIRIQNLIEKLTRDVPVDPEQRSAEQQGRWLLAHILEWHRREEKALWWEFFRLKALSAEELLAEKAAIGRLQLVETVAESKTGIPIHRYRFDLQDTDIRGGEQLYSVGGEKLGTAEQISLEDRTIDIKKSRATADLHPSAVYAHKVIDTKEQAGSLFRLGEYVVEHGLLGEGDYQAARQLLMRTPMDIGGAPFQSDGESTLDAALRIAKVLESGVLPIQGPPGTGKSFTGARMICELVKRGKTVGITANSHKVIRNLIDKVVEAAPDCEADLVCVQKPESGSKEGPTEALFFAKKNSDLIEALGGGGAQVAGATHFFWSREDAKDLVDVLVVDEAGQMSLANVLAVAQAAKAVIMLGDPQQLEQPTLGSHPDGTGVSALDHLLGGRQTITPEQGLFLGVSFRLHSDICAFNSGLFYEGKLKSAPGCQLQVLTPEGPTGNSGLCYMPVPHEGNTSASIEEAEAVKCLVENILAQGVSWIDREGAERKVGLDDILIIAPYNAQVFELRERLPEARVGTVDKFQGQEAPIAIYSMTTSSHADAPRGMEFLYSGNRFNVAISRAKCLAILVASPGVFEAECRTPRQMQLANAFCRYLEVSKEISPQ